MAAVTAGISNEDKKEFLKLTRMKYTDQAKWYLNGFWKTAEKEAENIWNFTQKFIHFDEKKKAGCELDEFWSHKFLESLGETLTVVALREKLRKIDLDANGRMALLEYLCFRFSNSVHDAVHNPQGGSDNQKEVDAAAALLETLNTSLTELQAQLELQQKALDSQRTAEAAVRKAEEESRAAVASLQKEQDHYNAQIAILDTKAKDEKLGAAKRGMAASELAQLKSKDPLPLNRAKLTAAASLKKVEAERKRMEIATAECEAQTKRVEADQADMQAKVVKAQEALQALKMKGGSAYGALWWMDREIIEAQKYLPKSKQVGPPKRN